MADSGVGSTTRDVITDFDHLADKIDLMGIDADTTVAGNQAFRWVGTAALTGAGRGRLLHLRRQHDHPRQQRRRRRRPSSRSSSPGIKALTVDDFYL